MALWTDLVTPETLTTVARVSAEERERERSSLSSVLPNKTVQATSVRMNALENGLVDAAEFRAYDAETSIGGGTVGKQITVELPPLGRKTRVGEYDLLAIQNRGNDQLAIDELAKAAVQMGRAVADRMELMRGQVLASGKATISENRFIAESDFGRDEELTSTVSTKWDDAEAKPLNDIEALVEKYNDINGEVPETMLVSRKVISTLLKSDQFRKMQNPQFAPELVTLDFINASLEAHGLPRLVRYDRVVRVNGKKQRVLDEKAALFLPGDGFDLGGTYWGVTLEAADPRYQIAEDDRPGIVAGAYQQDDPRGVWIHANAIGLPVLRDANLTASMQVLA